DFMRSLNERLGKLGELVTVEALTGPDQAKRVRADKDGRPITDGVFPESKEFLAGYWIVDVDTPERPYEIAAQASAAPPPPGRPRSGGRAFAHGDGGAAGDERDSRRRRVTRRVSSKRPFEGGNRKRKGREGIGVDHKSA